ETLARPPCTSVSIGNPSIGQKPPPEGFEVLRTYLPSHLDTRERRRTIEGSLRDLAVRSAVPELEGLEIRFRAMPPEDYASAWRKRWRAFRVGNLAVVPRDHPHELDPDDLGLILEPGGAFGSGRHATTRACLLELQLRVRGGESVLDAGSGSGILSVTAALLGAREVLGFDVDASAPVYGADLASENEVGGICSFRHGGFEVLGPEDTNFDAVLANIYSDVIEAEADNLRERLRPGGWFLFSGCPLQHRDSTQAAIEAAGLRIEVEHRRGRWYTFAGVRPPTS
ncbi:MAG: 50S ribosomal protein L11 methyltransferase, partial [Planctomycetota bacterium]